MTTPHSADALKQQCRAEFESHIRAKADTEEYATLVLQRNGLDEYSTVWVQSEWNGWQAAWNRRPTPASPDLVELRRVAEAATKGPWMRLFGERTVYDRMEDGCRGNAIVRADMCSAQEASDLDYIAAANPITILALLDRVERAEAAAAGAVPDELDRLRKIARKIGSIFVYGNFKAETHAERELEAMLREQGTFWDSIEAYESTLEEYEASITAAPKAAPIQQAEAGPSRFGSPELQAMIVARAVEKAAPSEPVAIPTIGRSKEFEAAAKALHRDWTPAGVHKLIDAADAWYRQHSPTHPAQDAGTGELLDLIAKHWRGDCWKGVTKSEAAEVNEVLANSGRTE